jgi:hypothetical protein
MSVFFVSAQRTMLQPPRGRKHIGSSRSKLVTRVCAYL